MAESKPIAELGGRTWEELEVSRHANGRIMFADELRKRNEKGQIESEKIRVCVPQPEDIVEARIRAVAWFASKKLDRKLDGRLFDEIEQLCLLARAIRNYDDHSQKYDAEDLARIDEASLHDIQERINVYKAILDPRDSDVTEERLWRLILDIGRAGNLLPLADIAGHEQHSCVLRMARAALLSPMGKSYVPSSGTSTPER